MKQAQMQTNPAVCVSQNRLKELRGSHDEAVLPWQTPSVHQELSVSRRPLPLPVPANLGAPGLPGKIPLLQF